MGSIIAHRCTKCGETFQIWQGGGMFFDLLHCNECGARHTVGHRGLGAIHRRFGKGLSMLTPYAVARATMDRKIQATEPGEPLTRAEYRAAVEATLEPCACGGRFAYAAPARCPRCRSTSGAWSKSLGVVIVD